MKNVNVNTAATIDKLVDFAAAIIGTAWGMADDARLYAPAVLSVVAHAAGVAGCLAVLTADILTDAAREVWKAAGPVCDAQGRALAGAAGRALTLLRAEGPTLLKGLCMHATACAVSAGAHIKAQARGLSGALAGVKAAARAAWQFRKECLA